MQWTSAMNVCCFFFFLQTFINEYSHCFNARHQFSKGNNLLIDTKYPSFDVCIMIVWNVINCKYRTVLFAFMTTLGPKSWVSLLFIKIMRIYFTNIWNYYYYIKFTSIKLMNVVTYGIMRWLAENNNGRTFMIVN